MNIYDTFMKNFAEVKSFNWNSDWDVLEGIEKPIDYARSLTDIGSLPKYDSGKHLDEKFSGFVRVDKEYIGINGKREMVEFMYLEKGKIKYFQCHEGNDKIYSKKFKFYDDNFSIYKSYSSNFDDKLCSVHRDAVFKFDGVFNVDFFRHSPKDGNVFVYSTPSSCFNFLVPRNVVDNLSLNIFEDYNNFFDYFKNFRGNIFDSNCDFEKKYSLEQAVDFLKNKK